MNVAGEDYGVTGDGLVRRASGEKPRNGPGIPGCVHWAWKKNTMVSDNFYVYRVLRKRKSRLWENHSTILKICRFWFRGEFQSHCKVKLGKLRKYGFKSQRFYKGLEFFEIWVPHFWKKKTNLKISLEKFHMTRKDCFSSRSVNKFLQIFLKKKFETSKAKKAIFNRGKK